MVAVNNVVAATIDTEGLIEMDSNKNVLFLTIVAALIFASCRSEHRVLYHQYRSMDIDGWETQNVMTFDIDSIPKDMQCRMAVGLRVTRDIQFQKIYLLVDQCWENPKMVKRDTVEVKLTDVMGNLEGDGIYIYTTEVDFDNNLSLKRGQTATVSVSHIMRRNLLFGVRDVGLKLVSD